MSRAQIDLDRELVGTCEDGADRDERFAIGIDIGGTGIKAALVDTATGRLAFDRVRMLTPRPAVPSAVAKSVAEVVEILVTRSLELGLVDDRAALDRLPLGCGFPGVVIDGCVHFAANLDPSWIGIDVEEFLAEATGHRFHLVNDADAAGLAEMTFGAGRTHRKRTVVLTTLGTGIGTALFAAGRLVPNTELGHFEMNGRDAETQAAESARVREGLEFSEWAERLQQYYTMLELLVAPDLIIVGGGVSKEHERFLPLITTRAAMRPAKLLNDAGIVGAALLAATGGVTRVGKRSESAFE